MLWALSPVCRQKCWRTYVRTAPAVTWRHCPVYVSQNCEYHTVINFFHDLYRQDSLQTSNPHHSSEYTIFNFPRLPRGSGPGGLPESGFRGNAPVGSKGGGAKLKRFLWNCWCNCAIFRSTVHYGLFYHGISQGYLEVRSDYMLVGS